MFESWAKSSARPRPRRRERRSRRERMRFVQMGFVFGAALALGSPALADPALRVDFEPAGVRVQLDGSFAGCTYTVSRAESPAGSFQPITASSVLCLGDCFAWDAQTLPGHTV